MNHTAPRMCTDLGVILDSGLTMQAQVAQIAKSCYHQIRNIGQIRSSITDDACKTLVHALVTARLDYANALLYGLPQTTCSVCNVCKTALPGSSALIENTPTSRQCCSIYTGYRFVCARHTKCFCLFIRLCMTKHRVTSRNYCHVVNPIAD